MHFSTKIDHHRIRHCNINRVKYSHKDLITNKSLAEQTLTLRHYVGKCIL